jgi:hypothetical protein
MPTKFDAESVRFRVEVRLDAETITGQITEETGTIRAFQGWIELIQAIEQAATHPQE